MDDLTELIEQVRRLQDDLRQQIDQLDARLEVSKAVVSGSCKSAVHPSTAALLADIFRSARVGSYPQSNPCEVDTPPTVGRVVGALRLVHSVALPSLLDLPPACPSLQTAWPSTRPALFVVSSRPSRDSGTGGGAAC